MATKTASRSTDSLTAKLSTDPDDDADVDVTNLTEDDIPELVATFGNSFPRNDFESLSGAVRVRITENIRSDLAAAVSVARRDVVQRYTEHPEEFCEEASPGAYKAMKRKLASEEGDTIVLDAAELTTLWDAVATYFCDLLDVDTYDSAINYLQATLVRADAALNVFCHRM